VEVLTQALAARDKKVSANSSSAADTSVKWTKFQEFFFKLKYGDLKDGEKLCVVLFVCFVGAPRELCLLCVRWIASNWETHAVVFSRTHSWLYCG
jgi:hypothetical protein